MIKYFALIVVIGLELGASGLATAQTAADPAPRRPLFNPFRPFSSSRLTVGRFGLPQLRAGVRNLFNSDASGGSATTSSAPAPAFAALELEPTPTPVQVRPPFRPPVRSPYRPPPRPPF